MISDFGTTNGMKVQMVTLRAEDIECNVLDLGCALRSLKVLDRNGIMRDILLGYDDADSYLHNSGHFGGIIGRYANRIKGGVCPIGDRVYQLSRNRGNNHMHGGAEAFDKRVWHISESSEDRVLFELFDPDGTEGYPGNMHVSVEYIAEKGKLTARYTATSDMDTVCNIINHAYFNLGLSDTVENHIVSVDSDEYTPLDDESVPTGDILPCIGTPMDLRTPFRVGDRLASEFPSIRKTNGYDCNWVLKDKGHCASAFSADTGIRMDVYTNMPGLQFYTGNGIKPGTRGKNGAVYGRWSGLCFETQHFPDAPNHPNFPSAVLKKGEQYFHETVYSFSAD